MTLSTSILLTLAGKEVETWRYLGYLATGRIHVIRRESITYSRKRGVIA